MAAVVRDPLCYSLGEACALLGISVRTAHRILANGQEELRPGVPAIRIGGRWKIPRRAVDSLMLVGDESARAAS